MEYDAVLVRYDEISLKSSSVRRKLIDLLRKNIEQALVRNSVCFESVEEFHGRLTVFTEKAKDAAETLSKVFGIVSTSPVKIIHPCTLNKAKKESGKLGKEILDKEESFAIRSRRVGNHGFTSMDLAKEAGAEVEKRTGASVDLEEPCKEIFLEFRENACFLFTEKIEGPGGIPLGSQGKMVALLSSGIDSPVAAWLMMKRGSKIVPVYFRKTEESEKGLDKTFKIIRVLSDWASEPITSLIVPFETLSNFLTELGKTSLTCLLCRRFMLKVAEKFAKKHGCFGLVTGESLGQVASQTYKNIYVANQSVEIPVHRPLIGLDKKEIIKKARYIGTYGLSTSVEMECPFTPDYPSTDSSLSKVLELEEERGLEKFIGKALEETEIKTIQ